MQTGKLLSAQRQHTYVLKLVGDVRLTLCCTLEGLFTQIFDNRDIHTIIIDLTLAEHLDSTTLGLLAKIAVKAKAQGLMQPSIISSNPDITYLLHSMGFAQYFMMMEHPATRIEDLQEVAQLAGSESNIHYQVLEAHRILMSMNEQNKEIFQSVVHALENCPESSI